MDRLPMIGLYYDDPTLAKEKFRAVIGFRLHESFEESEQIMNLIREAGFKIAHLPDSECLHTTHEVRSHSDYRNGSQACSGAIFKRLYEEHPELKKGENKKPLIEVYNWGLTDFYVPTEDETNEAFYLHEAEA